MDLESLRHHYLRRIVAPGLRLFGYRATERLAVAMARRVFDLNTPARRFAHARIERALGRMGPPGEAGGEPQAAAAGNDNVSNLSAAICKTAYEHIGRFWAESLFLQRRVGGVRWRTYVRIDDETVITGEPGTGRGRVFVTGYYGNPAAAAVVLGQLCRPVHVVVDYVQQPILRAWQRELYRIPNVRPVKRAETGSTLPRVLKGGGAILMIAEHHRPRGRAVEIEFLGERLRCYPTLERLAEWCDASVIPVTCRRAAERFSFLLEAHGVFRFETGRRVGDVTRGAMAALEAAILRDAGQYLWMVSAAREASDAFAARGMAENRPASTPQERTVPVLRPVGSAQ
ncbi:MAG: hypothetical protein DCC65_00105 [Planctomycetota bacterium]|nr:MAG: hypothetical protein DCC65_00105 [Planctomycetota bacterium]